MPDLDNIDIQALEEALPALGEYVDGIGRTDLASYSEDEIMGLIDTIVSAYKSSFSKLIGDEAPF